MFLREWTVLNNKTMKIEPETRLDFFFQETEIFVTY